MHKKYHKKFKILDILAVTTQAREGIDTVQSGVCLRQKKLYALLMSIQCLSPAKKSKCVPNATVREIKTWYEERWLCINKKEEVNLNIVK